MAAGRRWKRDELVVVLNLYHKLNFGQFDQRQPAVIALAEKLDRTPSSVAMKLSNFASLDPALKLRGIKGLEGASQLDRATWNELQESPIDFLPASEQAMRDLFEAAEGTDLEIEPSSGIRRRIRSSDCTEATGNVKQRRGQEFFREAVLNNFAGRCGVCGLPVRELLVASHILPWSKYPDQRVNVRNGLCLSRLYDGAFDRGLISFSDKLELLLSRRLQDTLGDKATRDFFGVFEGAALLVPDDAIAPEMEFIQRHRREIFQAS